MSTLTKTSFRAYSESICGKFSALWDKYRFHPETYTVEDSKQYKIMSDKLWFLVDLGDNLNRVASLIAHTKEFLNSDRARPNETDLDGILYKLCHTEGIIGLLDLEFIYDILHKSEDYEKCETGFITFMRLYPLIITYLDTKLAADNTSKV